MVHHVLTRTALYAAVWTEPIRTVARRLGVSDVGLAKACRVAGVPVPPRGYWTQRRHGKPTPPRPPLPPRPGGEQVVIAPPTKLPPAPPAGSVEATLAETVSVPDDLRRAHPIVRGWMAANAARRRQARREGWSSSRIRHLIEDLSTPLAQRRLRLTSGLLTTLQARGGTLGQDGAWLTVGRGEDRVAFRLYARHQVARRTAEAPRGDPRTTRVPAGDLVLAVRDGPRAYKELKTPLEAQLASIVADLEAGLVALGERRRQRDREAERRAVAEALRRKLAAYRAAEADLVERLVAQAERHAQAQAIRVYVAAADGSAAAAATDYADWRSWALAQADAMDPLRNGSAPFARLPPLEAWTWDGR